MIITKQRALEILKENIKNENLRKHHYAVACAMCALAEYFNEAGKEKSKYSSRHSGPRSGIQRENGRQILNHRSTTSGTRQRVQNDDQDAVLGTSPPDPNKWEIVGLLHDADYEETKDDPERHALVIAEKLESLENSEPSRLRMLEDIIYAIKAHNFEYTGVEPRSLMDWSLVACDDLTGLIVVVALVHPNKLEDVSVESVMKKFDSPSFASGADRERIKLCEEKLDIPLEEFVSIVLSAMKQNSEQLGL